MRNLISKRTEMELTELKNKIINSFNGSKNDLADILAMIDKDEAIFPFKEACISASLDGRPRRLVCQ